jgi:hypothetical protein
MSFDEYQAAREREKDARRERIRVEVYRAAAQIYIATNSVGDGSAMRDAVREALHLWETVEEETSKKREDSW